MSFFQSRRVLSYNTLRESTCLRVPNTAETSTAALLSHFPLILEKLSWETSLLVRSEILGLFGNMLTADCIYSHHR